MGISFCAAGDIHPGTSSSSPSTPPTDTSLEASPNGTWHICSQRACREQFHSHSARGHRSVVHRSVQWPPAAARFLVRLCLWFWPALPSASSRRNL